jgi:hypothetical protein
MGFSLISKFYKPHGLEMKGCELKVVAFIAMDVSQG